MTPAPLTQALTRMEGRHWLGLGASLVLHAIMFNLFQVSPVTPRPVTFEITMVPPEAAQLPTPKAKLVAAGHKPGPRRIVKHKTKKREADTLDLEWKREHEQHRDAPSVALPEEHPLGLPDTEEKPATQPARRLAQATPSIARPAVESGGQGLSEPNAVGQGQFQAGQPGRDAGIALTPAQTLAMVSAVAAAGAQPGNSIGQTTQAADPGQTGGSLAVSESSSGGHTETAGSGAASREADASQAAPGSEAQGIRLAVSTSLGGLAAVTPNGNVIATPVAGETGRAGTESGRGAGLSRSSGTLASAGTAHGTAGHGKNGPAVGEMPGRVSAKGGVPNESRPLLAGSGTTGQSLVAQPGKSTTAQTQAPSGPGQITLAPGEPGGSAQHAVPLRPVIAVIPARGLPAGGGHQAPKGTSSGSQGGAETSDGSSEAGGDAGGPGHRETLQQANVAAVKLVRLDTEAQPLDVLAPSSFCPLPGHQPDNRAPKPVTTEADKPTYAADNPSLYFPTLAMVYRTEGKVTARVEVLPDGRPGQILLKQSSGSAILDKDALDQLTRWHFVPAQRKGQAVGMWIDVPVIYRLPQNKAP